METFLEITKLLSLGAFLLLSILIFIILGAFALEYIDKLFNRRSK